MSSARFQIVWILVFCLTLPVAVVVSTHLARRSFEKVSIRDQTINVKGYAEQNITSDRATWSATLIARNEQLAAAYSQLEMSRVKLIEFLGQRGFANVGLSSVDVDVIYARDAEGRQTNKIESYVVRQTAGIGSEKVHDVARAAEQASELIKQGIELNGSAPQFIYTGLNALKLSMLGQASENARERAVQLVEHGGGRLGRMRSASQGVFQITPAFSTEVSNTGENDTTSIDKVIKAVVTQAYAID